MTDINEGRRVAYRLDIVSADTPKFHEQKELIKSSGASFDAESKMWYLWLAGALDDDAPRIDILFQAAREYGTRVTVQRVEIPAA